MQSTHTKSKEDASAHKTMTTIDTDALVEAMRLEVEVATTGQPNLIQNPKGEKGAWGWITPVANTAMATGSDTNGTFLQFNNSASQASYFTSEYLAGIAGKYYRAQFSIVGTSNVNVSVKVRFEWYDTNKTLLSSSTQSAATSSGTFYSTAVLAPASTVYVKLRVDAYTSGGNLASGAYVKFRNAMVTYSTTSSGLATSRTNLIYNPNAETSTSGWYSDNPTDVTRVTTEHQTGSAAFKARRNGFDPSAPMIVYCFNGPSSADRYVVEGGATYTVSFYTKAETTARAVKFFYNARVAGPPDRLVLATNSPSQTNVVGSWTRFTYTFTMPPNANRLDFTIQIGGNLPTGEVHYIDSVMLEKSETANAYFDGNTADTTTLDYAWTGTANLSPSTVTTTGDAFDFSEPNDWQDILGPTNEITISRAALDAGLLSATVLDAMLDPAVNDEVRPGKQIRLRVFSGGVWTSEYEGRITNATVTYDREKAVGSEVQTRITLTASDNLSHLANQGENRGVGNIASLPYILEGKGAPWNVNGSGNQVTSATIVSYNENASVVDQVAVARDTALGYAWVDKRNVLNVYDKASMNNTVVTTFTDTAAPSYSDIDVNFNTDSCINTVNINWLRYDSGTGSTESITYGPYKNATSIATWGARSADFTIQGATEVPADIATYANNILTANSTPEIRANSLVFPIRNTTDLATMHSIDLYSLVGVAYDTKVDDDYRVTGIEHSIKADKDGVKWTVTYAFDINNSVAAPTFVPAPPFTGTTETTALFNNVTVLGLLTATGFVKTGLKTINVSAINTLNTGSVTFTTPFPASGPVPTVMLTLNNITSGTAMVRVSVANVTRSGFDIQIVRTVGAGNTDINWLAIAQ